MSSITALLLTLLAVETGALIAVAVLYRKAKKAAKVRRVEAPNSQYKSPYVLDLEAQDRWERMDLESLHEVNREEVVKLLEKVRADGVRGLSESEREFLDRMADAAGRTARRPRADGPSGPAREVPRTS